MFAKLFLSDFFTKILTEGGVEVNEPTEPQWVFLLKKVGVGYFADKNSIVVYGYEGKDTQAAVAKLNAGTGLSGDLVNVQN